MKCLYACNQAGAAIEAIPHVWLVLGFTAIVAFGIYLCFWVINVERELSEKRQAVPDIAPRLHVTDPVSKQDGELVA